MMTPEEALANIQARVTHDVFFDTLQSRNYVANNPAEEEHLLKLAGLLSGAHAQEMEKAAAAGSSRYAGVVSHVEQQLGVPTSTVDDSLVKHAALSVLREDPVVREAATVLLSAQLQAAAAQA